jgi:hypothetical protein
MAFRQERPKFNEERGAPRREAVVISRGAAIARC